MVIEILDQIVEVLGEEVVDLREFTRILISGFEEKEIGIIPMSIDQVNIGDISVLRKKYKGPIYYRSKRWSNSFRK